MTYKLGVLDQSPIYPGQTGEDALQSSVRLAKKTEEWGYHRFWVAEHHQTGDVAGTSPEILISYLLAQTSSIKIGAGGVMLQHYSPYKVAENFHVLASLAPNRVELGIGKAPGGFSISTEALRYGGPGDEISFDERFTTLQHLIHDTLPSDHLLHGAQPLPKPKETVPTFLLGASPESAEFAAKTGANFVFARFLNGDDDLLRESIHAYRSYHSDGKFIIAVAAIAASSQLEAETLAESYKIFRVLFESGKTVSVKSEAQLEVLREQTDEPFEFKEQKVDVIAGSAEHVKEELDQLASVYHIDEFILQTPVDDEEKRLESYKLLGKYNYELLKGE